MSLTSKQIIGRLYAGEGLFPFWKAVHIPGGILSQFTWKVLGQFALAGEGDAGGENMGVLEN